MGKQWSKTVNLVTAIIDFAMALIMMMLAISGRSILALFLALSLWGGRVFSALL